MKKIFVAFVAVFLFCGSFPSWAVSGGKNGKMRLAQRDVFEIGPTFGVSFFDLKDIKKTNVELQGGLTMQFNLPAGFSFQPSFMYSRQTAIASENGAAVSTVKTGYITVPVGIQWGPDLVVCRPYIETVPFVGYALHNSIIPVQGEPTKNYWDGVERFEYGVGVGVGFEIFRFQIAYRYMWSLSSFGKGDVPDIFNGIPQNKKYRGSVITVSFLF